MKQILLFIVLPLFFINVGFGQSLDELNLKTDSLNALIKEIDVQIEMLDQRKTPLKRQIAELNQKKSKLEWEHEFLEGILVTINSDGGRLRDKPNIMGDEIIKIPAGDTVFVYNWYEYPYFKAAYKEKVGYISYSSFNKNLEIRAIINKGLFDENPELTRLTKKYGKYSAEKIIKRECWIGMTAEMARESVGHPDDVNRSTYSWGIHEHWFYKNKDLHLFFEDGKLTSIHD